MTWVNRQLDAMLARWSLSSSSGLHLSFMDGLRGIAILLVVIAHTLYSNPDGPRILILIQKIAGAGILGVPLFFVLSGFLISYPFFKARLNQPGYWYQNGYATRRALKVIPPFYFTIILLAAIYYARSHDAEYFKLGLSWATGLAHFIYSPIYFNTSFWSLWVEVHFYIVLPFLFLAFRGSKPGRTAIWIFAALTVVSLTYRHLVWDSSLSSSQLGHAIRRFPGALDGFAWGVLFAGSYVSLGTKREQLRSWATWGYVGAILFALDLLIYGVLDYQFDTGEHTRRWSYEMLAVGAYFPAFLILFFAFDPSRWGSRVLASPALRFLGVISFEWFLLHQPFIIFSRELMGSSHGSLLRYLVILGLPFVGTLLAAALLYRYFSLPILRWGRDRIQAGRAPRPPEPTSIPG